jgi:DNA polymerase-3 subunit beta
MKISCEREKLLAAFSTAAAVAPARSPKPILQNVKLEVKADQAIFSATDLEVGVRVPLLGVDVQAPGTVILPVAKMSSILRESSDSQLRIESDGSNTLIKGVRSKFTLPSHEPGEFPAVVEFKETKYHEVSAKLLKELIRRTIFATDNESSRYALGGVLLEMSADKIVGVSTDGRRLAKMEIPAKSVGGHESGEAMTIVPTKALHLIERAMGDGDEVVQIAARANEVLIQSSKAMFYSRLVEGRFPRWREVFPTRQDAEKIDVNVGPLYAAVRQAAIVTSEESRGVDFAFAKGELRLDSKAQDVGQSVIELPIAYDGRSMTVTLDPRFVGDFLKVLDPERTITLDIKDSDSSVVCLTDDGYGYVIMPLSRDR